MPNSDTQDGLHNKITKIIYQKEVAADGSYPSNVAQSFSGNLTTAKDFFLTAEAQTLNDTNGTQIEYAIHADGNGLIFTIAFGTKGAGTAEADDWAGTWKTGKKTLVDAGGWYAAAITTGLDTLAGRSGLAENNSKSDEECTAIGNPKYALAADSGDHLF